MEEEREEMAVHDVELHEALEEAVEQLLSICARVCCPALREAPAVPPHAPAGTLAAAGARSSRTLFAPTLAVEASAVLGAAPSLGVVRHLIAYAVAQLRHAPARGWKERTSGAATRVRGSFRVRVRVGVRSDRAGRARVERSGRSEGVCIAVTQQHLLWG